MKFGTYFAYWEQEWLADYAFYCNKVAKLGFDVLEIAASGLEQMNSQDIAELKSASLENGIELTCCIGLPKQYSTSSLIEPIREAGVNYLKRILDAMQKVGSKILGGIIYSYWPADYSQSFEKDKEREQAIKSMKEVAEYAKKYDIMLALETVNRFEQYLINDAAEAVQLVKDIDKPNVKVMLDCFHMNIEEDNIGDAIRETGKYLGHYHIGEANRKVPGKGHIPWDEIGKALKDIKYTGHVVMEPFVKPGGTVGKDIKVWRDLSQNADVKMLDKEIEESLKFLKVKFEMC